MANVRYRKRGKKSLWSYEIRQSGQVVDHGSGFKSKKEAALVAESILMKLRTGGVLNKDMTLAELYQAWLDLKVLPSAKSDVTKSKYQARKAVIELYFSDMKISEIRPSFYQGILNDYGKKVGRDVLRRFHNSIAASVKMAIADNVIMNDFTYNIETYSIKKSQDKEDKYLHSVEDYETVLDYLITKFDYQNSVVPFIIYCLFVTGMRYGELIALTWEDIDLENRVIKTYRRLNTVTNEFVPPKNKTSIRTIPIDKELVKLFMFLQKMQESNNRILGVSNKRNLVFQHFGYKYDVPVTNTVNKELKLVLEELKITPIITTKGARHTYGSYLWHCGIDLGVIARILGHKDISMLVEVYGHTLEEKIEDEFESVRTKTSQMWGKMGAKRKKE